MTVVQLEQALREVHGKRDRDVARQLSRLELTERLNSERLRFWEGALQGKKSRDELEALADSSVFLQPPATEIPALAPADVAAQRQMMALMVDYLGKVVPKLPDLSAAEDMARYENVSGEPDQAGGAEWRSRSWQLTDNSKVGILRIGGKVNLAPRSSKKKVANKEESGQIAGIFGPALSTLIVDAARGKFAWSRWERGATGLRAVFRYEVPKADSNYEITYFRVGDKGKSVEVRQRTGYHGEVAIEPESGAILRMTIVADLDAGLPIDRTDVMVEYGPVQMDGKTYDLPLKGVTITSGPNATGAEDSGNSVAEVTVIEEIGFDDYRVLDASSPTKR